MECKVLRENIVLQVALTVKMESGACNKTVENTPITFLDSLSFSAKHITYNINNTYDSYGRQPSAKYQNIVMIRIGKIDQNDKTTYRIILSCPELNIKKSIFYSDESQWRVVNENSKNSAYTFEMTLQVEALTPFQFSILYDDDKLTDYKLKGHDGEIDIHKAFLAAISTSFRSLVTQESNKDSLDIPDTSVNTLQNFKKCIYTQVLPDDNLNELLLLASYFKITWLEYKCVDRMMQDMSPADAINLLEFALDHRHMPLFLGIMDHVQCGGIKMSQIRKHYLSK